MAHRATKHDTRQATVLCSADEFEEFKKQHAHLQAHSRFLQERLDLYASALSLLAAENTALAERPADSAKLRVLPQHGRPTSTP